MGCAGNRDDASGAITLKPDVSYHDIAAAPLRHGTCPEPSRQCRLSPPPVIDVSRHTRKDLLKYDALPGSTR